MSKIKLDQHETLMFLTSTALRQTAQGSSQNQKEKVTFSLKHKDKGRRFSYEVDQTLQRLFLLHTSSNVHVADAAVTFMRK